MKRCECCGEEETASNLVGYCHVAEMWMCERCCEECYDESYPYGCPENGLDFDYDKEDADEQKRP